MQADSKREDLRQLFFFILHRVEHDCNLHSQLASSQHFAQHVSRLLAPFSVGTLKQYLNARMHFTHFCVLFVAQTPVSARASFWGQFSHACMQAYALGIPNASTGPASNLARAACTPLLTQLKPRDEDNLLHAPGTASQAATLQASGCSNGLKLSLVCPRRPPRFLFLHSTLHTDDLEELAPASYSHTLVNLRHCAQSPSVSRSAALQHREACALTLHSMQSTVLAASAQLDHNREDRLAQGRHRDSAQLYSRNDTLASLRIQRKLACSLASGWRPQRSRARGGAARAAFPCTYRTSG